MERSKEIERSIIKKFRKVIYSPFVKAVIDFNLVEENDKIAVCISGGKDSMLLAKCLEELARHGKRHFELVYLVMNPGYTKEVMAKIRENAQILNIDIKVFESPIFDVVGDSDSKIACYRCAKMRRGYLYNEAKKLGCNKIALGHHLNDVIETIMLNMLYTGTYAGMLPKLKSTNYPGMELIRPLFYVREEDIVNFKKYNNLEFIDCACSITKKSIGKRKYIKELIAKLKEENPLIEKSIFNSQTNVNLNKIVKYNLDEEEISYYDNY